MGKKRFSWLKKGLAVLRKDLHTELRTRYAYSALFMFAVTTMVTVSFSVGGFVPDTNISASLLWVIIFFSAMTGLSRTFGQEEETGTVIALKMAADPEPVFIGKYLFNIVLLLSLAVLVVPLYLIMFNLPVIQAGGFIAALFLGVIGLAGAGTILAAIASKAGAKGALFTVLSFPILLPLLVGAISVTRTALGYGDPGAIALDLWLLIFYNGTVAAVSFLLFEYVWNG